MGRSTELEQMDRLLDGVLHGTGGRLLVVGPPGIGKSGLLSAVQRRAVGRGLRTTRLRGVDGAGDVRFALLDDWERGDGGASPIRIEGRADRCADLVQRLVAMVGEGPLLLMVDEAQFADADSLDCIAVAAARVDDLPILVLVATRPELEVTGRFATWPRLELGRLSTEASLAILRVAVGSDHEGPVLSEIAEALDGNPLALTEAAHLLTREQITGRDPLPSVLPVLPLLDRAWGTVLDRLPNRAQRALLDLAVAGPRAELLAALGRESDWTDADLDDAVAAGLVVPQATGSPRFAHRVVGDVVAGRAPPGLLRATNRRAADLARDLGLPVAVVIDHLMQSVVTVDSGVADLLEQEAERAERLDQLWVASDAWQAAARVSPTPSARVARALRGLRLVITNGLDYAGTDALLDLLAGEQLDDECASWVDWLRTLQRSDADPETALIAQWSSIRRASIAAPDTLRALLWDAAMNAWTLGDSDGGLRAAREYAAVESVKDPEEVGVEPPWTGIALIAAALFQSGDVAQASGMRAEAIRAASEMDPTSVPFDRLLSTVFLDDVLLDTSPASGDRLLVATQRMSEKSAPLACLYGIQAWRARARGDWLTAREMLTRGRPVAAVTGATGAQLGMATLAVEMAALCGPDDVLRSEARLAREQATRRGDRRRLATMDRALGLRALVDGRLDEAIVWLTAAADVPFLGRGLRDGVLPARVDLVEALVRRGDLTGAVARADAVRPLLAAMADPLASALESRVSGLVTKEEVAEQHFRAALAVHVRAREPFEEARTQLLLGEQLRRDRQPAAARVCFIEAVHAFEQLGASPWLARASSELRAAGGRIAAEESEDVLTAQERSVARAVASGRTNREVGEALFLSPRTVEYHLGNVYRKLGIRGRAQLVRHFVTSLEPDA